MSFAINTKLQITSRKIVVREKALKIFQKTILESFLLMFLSFQVFSFNFHKRLQKVCYYFQSLTSIYSEGTAVLCNFVGNFWNLTESSEIRRKLFKLFGNFWNSSETFETYRKFRKFVRNFWSLSEISKNRRKLLKLELN